MEQSFSFLNCCKGLTIHNVYAYTLWLFGHWTISNNMHLEMLLNPPYEADNLRRAQTGEQHLTKLVEQVRSTGINQSSTTPDFIDCSLVIKF